MKRLISFTCIIALLNILFLSCTKPPCFCNFTSIQHLEIKISNRQGQNLVFGPARLFSADSISVLKTNNDLTVHSASVNRSSIDTAALRFDFYVTESRSFLYYDQQTKSDTLDIEWSTKTGECCSSPQTFQTIDGVKLNGVPLQANNNIYVFVK